MRSSPRSAERFERIMNHRFRDLISSFGLQARFKHGEFDSTATMQNEDFTLVVEWERMREPGLTVQLCPSEEFDAPGGRWNARGVDLTSFISEAECSQLAMRGRRKDEFEERELQDACRSAEMLLTQNINTMLQRLDDIRRTRRSD